MRPNRKMFPVNLMLEGKTAIVIGGGKVGLRKTQLLVDAGINVKIISPDCVQELKEMHGVTCIQKIFEPSDLETSAAIVFACTNDRSINREVLIASRKNKIPCCCADGNWAVADFTTPASVRANDLLISISTNGQSCSRAKQIKTSLTKHFGALASSDLFITGISHEELAINLRTEFHIAEKQQRRKLAFMLRQIWGIHAFMFINTCNRMEIVAMAAKETRECGIIQKIAGLPSCAYALTGDEAFLHFVEVMAGLKSQVPGEFHIVGQIRDALEESQTEAWSSGIMSDWYTAAKKIAQPLREELAPQLAVAEIETVCEDFIIEKNWLKPDCKITIVGSGVIATALMKWAIENQTKVACLYHKNPTELKNVKNIPLTEWRNAFADSDIVISAISSTSPFANAENFTAHFIDLGVPRNIEGKNVIDLDDLKNNHRKKSGQFELAAKAVQNRLPLIKEAYEAVMGARK